MAMMNAFEKLLHWFSGRLNQGKQDDKGDVLEVFSLEMSKTLQYTKKRLTANVGDGVPHFRDLNHLNGGKGWL